jgi:hypothetical protein
VASHLPKADFSRPYGKYEHGNKQKKQKTKKKQKLDVLTEHYANMNIRSQLKRNQPHSENGIIQITKTFTGSTNTLPNQGVNLPDSRILTL